MKPHLPRFIRSGKKPQEKKAANPIIDFQRAGLAVATVVILSIVLSIQVLPNKVSMRLGDISTETIVARKKVRYKDTIETELRRAQAAAGIGKVYDPVAGAADQSISALKTVFLTVERIDSDYASAPLKTRISKTREQLGLLLGPKVPDLTLGYLLSSDKMLIGEVQESCLRLVSAGMGKEVRDDPRSLRAARAGVIVEAIKLLPDRKEAEAVGDIAARIIRPNRVYNEDRTLQLQEQARKGVQPIYRDIQMGEVVITKGDTVLQSHMEKFEALGLIKPKADYGAMASLAVLVIVVVWIVAAYMSRYHSDIYLNNKALWLLAMIILASAVALRVGGTLLGITLNSQQIGYLGTLWIVTAGMFITVMLNPQIAVLITTLLSIVLSMTLNNELRYAVSALVLSLVGIYSVANIRDRHDSLRSGAALAGVGMLLVWVMGGLNGDMASDMLRGSVWAVITGFAAAWIFWTGTLLLERPFGRTTHISLLELADTNKPLLRRLSVEAPGTSSHSMVVGYLAESAAEAIQADSLVARVASYYHDIGKIRRPHFFIENQSMDNVHDRMNPTLSALVITSHIKDGIDIAKEFKMPRVVLDIIAQHHGTSLVQYFFNQITDEQEPSTALEQQFRYPGPKPQTKEAAIVMLADAVEAASRAMIKPTPAKIELLVNRIVADKLRDGQLDQSELTFRDVSKITDSFVRNLISINHARIEYPDAPGAEERKNGSSANTDSEPQRDKTGQQTDQEPGQEAVAG